MHDMPVLRDLVVLVAVAIPVVVLAHRLRVPSVVGFLLTGMVIGPHGLGLIGESVNDLAEVGTVLLLFAIGLELQLSRILKLGREVVQGGSLQLISTALAVGAAAHLLGQPANRALFFGALVAFSSTAIILKVYAQRNELDSPHGRVVIAIAIFQDLAVVPVMLLVPVLAGSGAGGWAAARQSAISLLPVAGLIVVGRYAVPVVLARIVQLRNREVFTLAIVFLGLSAAFVVSRFGIPLALGAFIAGLVIAESEYGLQALADVLPFRDTFSGIFFTSVGMLLDVGGALQRPALVIGAAVLVIVAKAALGSLAVLSLKRPLVSSLIAGIGLAQVGEFSFVLASAGASSGLLPATSYQLFLAVAVLSMLVAPFFIAGARPIAQWLAARAGQLPRPRTLEERTRAGDGGGHVIIVGYGLNGRNLARALRSTGISYVILEQTGALVRQGREDSENIRFGDGTHPEVLERVGIHNAEVIVFAIAEAESERRGVAVARSLNPDIFIVVRTRYVKSVEELKRLGANEVVPEEFETSLEIFSRVLRRYGVPGSAIRREVDAARRDHYDMFRGTGRPFVQLTDLAITHGVHVDVDTLPVESGAVAVGKNPVTMALRKTSGATTIAVIRGGKAIYEPSPDFRFQQGDTVVLVGTTEALDKARPLFRSAGH